MTRWTDYCISIVRYNNVETHFNKFMVHVNTGDT